MISTSGYFTVILLLSFLCVIIQSAPVRREEDKSSELSTKTQEFYCTSVLLKNLAKYIVQERHSVALPSEHGNGTYDHESVNLLLKQFKFTCRTFTNVMIIKHQLYYSLFNGSYYKKNNGVVIKADNGDMKNLTLILEYLQKLGSTLQDIENILTNKYCIEFTPAQYKKLYWNLINGSNVSVLNTLQNMKWAIVGEYPKEWSNPPKHYYCNNSS